MKTHGQSDNGSRIPNHTRRDAGFGIIGAVLLLILINGCASTRDSKDADPWQYNYNTGYPAVGSPVWLRQ